MEVEVVFPDICGAFYKGKLLDINISDSKCLVTFDENWKPNTWVELQYVRFPPQSSSPGDLDLTPGSKIEALLPFKEGEPSGWWLATVTKSKGEVAGVQFQSSDRQYTDLVEHRNLRPPNENPPLSTIQFNQKEFPVPEDIQEFCQDIRVHQNFRSKIKALNVSYDNERACLIVLADNMSSLERAEILIDMHFSDLSTQATLRSRTEKAAQRLQGVSQPVQESTSGVYEEKVVILPECIGFAMGRQGWNVNQARQIPGIIGIEFDDYKSIFTIRAESKEAAQEARILIEFTRDIIHVPRDLAGKVIGRGGNIVQQILEKSRLNNIKVIGDEEAEERRINKKGEVPFELLGRRKAIENAKLMFDYHLDHLREVNNILQDREEISQKLRDSGLDDPPTYYPRPNPPRGWGGTRGRGRGKGRGGGRPRQRRPPREQDQNHEEEHGEGGERQDYSDDDSESTEENPQPNNEEQVESHSDDDFVDRRRQRGGRRGRGQRRRRDERRDETNSVPNEVPIESEDWPAPGATATST